MLITNDTDFHHLMNWRQAADQHITTPYDYMHGQVSFNSFELI